MATAMKVLRELTEGRSILRALAGDLDERLSPAIFTADKGVNLILDLDRVAHVTSFGVREWIRGLQAARGGLAGLYFVRASPRVTDQFNMVVGFDGGGTLLTFRAFYHCDACGQDSESSFDAQLDRESFDNLRAPVRQCRVCGRDAELDDDPAVLFEYIRAAAVSPPPAEVMAVLRHADSWLDEMPGVRLTVRSSVAGDASVFRLAGLLDNTLPTRRIVESTSGKTVVALNRVTHVDPTALERWRTMLVDLHERGQVRLVGVPPVMLRRAAADPQVLAGAAIESVALPVRCKACRMVTWANVGAGEPFAAPPADGCATCGQPLSNVTPPEDLLAFQHVVLEHPSTVPARPSPARPERARTPTGDAEPVKPKESFEDKYEVLCKIGQGGMADVFLARQLGAMGFRRLVVVKRVKQHLLTDDRMIRLFLDEARLAALIDHQNVVRVHDLGRDDDSFFMVMDFVHGKNLTEILREVQQRGERVPPKVAAHIAADLCFGLARAHALDTTGRVLVHRDVTPNNVMVSFSGVVKLTDFGLAGYHHFQKDELRQNHILGNVPFVAPEIYQGKDAVPASDIWGVALTAYQMLTGVNPFARDSVQATARAIVRDKVRRPWRRIPWRLFRVIKDGLEKKPEARPQSAGAFGTRFRAWAGGSDGQVAISAWLRDIFPEQLRFEHQLMNETKTSSVTDALLSSSATEVARFFNHLRDLEAGKGGGRPAPATAVSHEAETKVTSRSG